MKAATRSSYGPPDVLSISEADIPIPGEHELLIRVYTTTVNRTDCAILLGKPFIMRFFTGLFKPSSDRLGTDFAGSIEAVGKQTELFKAGDRVWGFNDMGLGSHAEYMVLRENKAVTTIPVGISYDQAVASAEGAHYAFNFINKVKIRSGQKVLVNGATGAIGSSVLQFVKSLGANVTAVCSTENIELVTSLGADKVIDYLKEDFTRGDEKYDYVFDAVGKSTFGKCKPILKEKGIYISSELGPYSQNIFLALFTPLFGGRKVIFPLPKDINASLSYIKRLLQEGKFRPLIDRSYPLEQIAEAYRFVLTGQKKGNVLIRITDDRE